MPPPHLEARDYIGLGAAAGSSSSCSSTASAAGEAGPHLALRLGLPGCESPGRAQEEAVDAALTLGPAPAPTRGGAKRGFADSLDRSATRDAAVGGVSKVEKGVSEAAARAGAGAPPAAKAQVVGWPPVRNYRKNTLAANATKTKAEDQGKSEAGCCYVKVSMDGAPYLRKVDLKTYSSYENLSLELEKMFSCFITGKSSSCKTSTRDRLTGSGPDALQDQEYVLTYEDKDADWMLVGDLPWNLFTTICRKLRIMRGSDAAGMGSLWVARKLGPISSGRASGGSLGLHEPSHRRIRMPKLGAERNFVVPLAGHGRAQAAAPTSARLARPPG